jgi:hypothetical protein
MASFWGTGAPKVNLRDYTGAINRAITLATPDRGGREFYWELVDDPIINPLTRVLLPRKFGFRAVFRLQYSGPVSETVEDLVDIANSPLSIQVTPYSGVAALNFFAVVSSFKTAHKDGYVGYDWVEIIFKGIELKPNIPNFDTYYAVSRNKSIYTAP